MSNPLQTRREFLRSAVRTTLLGAAGFLGAILFRRQLDCKTRGGCGLCTASEGCTLPWKEAKR